jgi:hypothetical protein
LEPGSIRAKLEGIKKGVPIDDLWSKLCDGTSVVYEHDLTELKKKWLIELIRT